MKGGVLQARVTLLLRVQHFSSCSRGTGGTVTGIILVSAQNSPAGRPQATSTHATPWGLWPEEGSPFYLLTKSPGVGSPVMWTHQVT